MSGIQKLFELRVRDRIFVDPKRTDVNGVQMMTAGRIFPGILHVDADITETFDFDAVDLEAEIGGRKF